MNESQIKLKIIFFRTIDWILFAIVLGIGLPALMYTDKQFISLVFIILGLAIVHLSGNWTMKKVASYRIQLEKLRRQEKVGY